jgi:hypothetical protein
MAVELTPRVAQDTGGFGFQVPVFRMNQGVSAATANPMSRAAMQPMEMISEGQFGLNPNVLAMADESARAQFFAGVDELNQFVNKAAEFGIDPSKVDMSVPESFALNQEFRNRVQALQQQARGITTGAAQIAAAERAQNLAFQQQQRLDYATDRELKLAEQEEKRLEKGFLQEISSLAPKIKGVLGEQNQQYGAAQSAAFRKDQAGLIKQLETKRQQLMDQPDNVYKLQRLDEIIQQVAGVTTRPEDPRSSTTGLGGITSIKPGEMIPLTAPTSMDGLMNPVINERGQTIAAVPTVESVTLMPYYVDNQGKRIPVTSPSDPNASRIEGRAFVGVGFAKKPKMTESEIKNAVDKEKERLFKIPKSEMSVRQVLDRLAQFEEQLRSEPETERSFVVLPEDRAQQLLQAKGSTIAPTKRQAQKMGAVESLIKSSGVKK